MADRVKLVENIGEQKTVAKLNHEIFNPAA